MQKGKMFSRIVAVAMLIVLLYFGGTRLYENMVNRSAQPVEAPYVVLKDGTIATPDMITTVNYDKNTFREMIAMLFEDADEPEYSDFLSHFTCNGCHKNCLLLTPSCSNGRSKQAQATEVYQELYPDMEIEL